MINEYHNINYNFHFTLAMSTYVDVCISNKHFFSFPIY